MFKQILDVIITPAASKATSGSTNDQILFVKCYVFKQQGADRALGSVLDLVLQRIIHKNCISVQGRCVLCAYFCV